MAKNTWLLKKLRARFLRMRHGRHFDMTVVAAKNECGTAMCIAGHTLALAGYRRKYDKEIDDFDWFSPEGDEVDPLDAAQDLLGLNYREAQYVDLDLNHESNGLFYRYDLKTPEQAAREIEKLIEA